MDEVRLERFKYAMMQVFPKEMIVDFSDSMDSYIRDTVAMRVTRMVYGHRLAETDLEVLVPKNWWQHLKLNLGFRSKSVPVTGRVVRKRIYPDLPVLPESSAGVSFVVEDFGG